MNLSFFIFAISFALHTSIRLVSYSRSRTWNSNYGRHRVGLQMHIETSMPRLNANVPSLYSWIQREGGFINEVVTVNQTEEGWTIVAESGVTKQTGEVLGIIPRHLCMYASQSKSEEETTSSSSLLPATKELMRTVHPSQWRARLAIALLSERVRPNSFFKPYLSNLPFEFWGLPMFFNSTEFEMIQDPSLMQKQLERCKFLLEFSNEALIPLTRTPLDPFSGYKPSVDAFGWAFAAASSRAFRSKDLISEEDGGEVLIPLLDLISHSNRPNCQVVLNRDNHTYELITLQPIDKGQEITINYGPFSNEEFFGDYGFSVDDNENDELLFKLDAAMIDTSRTVMGQREVESQTSVDAKTKDETSDDDIESWPIIPTPIGRAVNEPYNELWLYQWQIMWLRMLRAQIKFPGANFGFTLKGSGAGNQPPGMDGRAYAFLRVLYSREEEDITSHGYTPMTLKDPSAILSSNIEKEVIRTLVGVVSVLLRVYGTSEKSDIHALKSGYASILNAEKASEQMRSDDIVADARQLLRDILEVKEPLSVSPTARKYQLLQQMMEKEEQKLATKSKSTNGITGDEAVARVVNWSLEKTIQTELESDEIDDQASDHLQCEEKKEETVLQEDIPQSKLDGIRSFLGEERFEEEFGSLKTSESIDAVVRADTTSEYNVARSDQVVDIRASRNTSDIASLGYDLPPNIREILKYRIRRKRGLAGIIKRLALQYKQLSKLQNELYDTNKHGKDDDLGDEEDDNDYGDLLPSAQADKKLRKVKLREMLDKMRNGTGSFKGKEEKILAAVSSVSKKFEGKGLSL